MPKRQSLVLEALAHTKKPVRVRFAGAADQPAYQNELKSLARKLRVHNRVEWLGQIDEPEKRELYARALGVVYPPIDEDYGYVTLEAMLASKPLIVCTDSGGPLEFVRHEETGLIAEPEAASLAKAFDRLWEDRSAAKKWGEAGQRSLPRDGYYLGPTSYASCSPNHEDQLVFSTAAGQGPTSRITLRESCRRSLRSPK